jgi:hypothetical protein
MKNMQSFFLPFIAIVVFTSCYTSTPKYLYAANSTNLLQTNKNDVKIAAGYAKSSHRNNNSDDSGNKQQSNGIEILAAYGVGKNVNIKASGTKRWETDESEGVGRLNIENSYKLNYKRAAADVSLGYKVFIAKSKIVSVNIDAGLGFGSTTFTGRYRDEPSKKYYYSARHSTFFVAPFISIEPTKTYAIKLAYRISSINFSNINSNDTLLTKVFYNYIDGKQSVYGDFVIDNEFGFDELKGVRFYVQFGFTKLFTQFNSENPRENYPSFQYEYNNSFGSLGVIVNLQTLLKNTKP